MTKIVFAQDSCRLQDEQGLGGWDVVVGQAWAADDPLVLIPRNRWHFGPEPPQIFRSVHVPEARSKRRPAESEPKW